MTPLERLARALCGVGFDNCQYPDCEMNCALYTGEQVRAVLEELREMGDDDAVWREAQRYLRTDSASNFGMAWQAAIDHILTEGGGAHVR